MNKNVLLEVHYSLFMELSTALSPEENLEMLLKAPENKSVELFLLKSSLKSVSRIKLMIIIRFYHI